MEGSLSESSCATPVASSMSRRLLAAREYRAWRASSSSGLQVGGLDFGDLMAQQFEFALQGGLVRGEAGVLLAQAASGDSRYGLVLLARTLRVAEGVEQAELPFRAEQRLVIVRPVQIYEQVAELLEHGQRRRRAVDELPVSPRLREGAFDDEIALDATLQAVPVEFGVERAAVVYIESTPPRCRHPRRCG